MKLRQRLAEGIKRLRARSRVSQMELAERARMSRPFLGSLERGERAATVDTIDKIAHALGVDPADLVRKNGRHAPVAPAEVLGQKIAFLAGAASPGSIAAFERIAIAFFKGGAKDRPGEKSGV